MKQGVIWCLSGLLVAAGMATSKGSVTEGPYQAIVKRNAFDLRPVPEQHLVDTVVPFPQFTLVGITTILGDKRVFMKMQPPGPHRATPEERSIMLIQGQPEGDIEVLEIDEWMGCVKLRYAGRVTTVAFERVPGKGL
jgi:hypothetical protein